MLNLTTDPATIFRDQQHASRLFIDDNFRLAPKFKFLFHVVFSINRDTLIDTTLVDRHRNEINMLVKAIDLPRFDIRTDVLNQYNRKKVVQYHHEYKPITVTFHDDNMGLINHMWQNYYAYYYADSISANVPGAYARNSTKNSNYIKTSYGLDTGSKAPFFNYIKIFQMARHEYTAYTLYNPLITDWNHNKLEYATHQALHDFTMMLQYESVSYSTGIVSAGNPEGFGTEHYDQTPSPIHGPAYNQNISPSFANTQTTNFVSAALERLNAQQASTRSQPYVTNGIITNIGAPARQNIGGIREFAFPTTTIRDTTILATPR